MKPKILALIPARGGSKGLPRKNIIPLAGKPLIAWTIGQALKCNYINKLVVSTDDNEIAEVSKYYGAEVPFLRPKELAKDDSPTSETIKHAIEWFEKENEYFDILVLLEPTSPLRTKNDLNNAIELFCKNFDKVDSLVSIGKVHLENPYIMKNIEDGYVRPLIEKDTVFFQRQMLPEIYFPYGVVYISKINSFKERETFYQERTIPFYIERWQNYEIDDYYDLLCIEAILKSKLEEDI